MINVVCWLFGHRWKRKPGTRITHLKPFRHPVRICKRCGIWCASARGGCL